MPTQEKSMEDRMDEVGEAALNSLPLSAEETKKLSKDAPEQGGEVKVDKAKLKAATEKEEESEEEEEEEEEAQEEESQKESEEDEEDEEEEEEEDEVIPKSKVDKITARMEKRIDSLTSQIKIQEEKPKVSDSRRDKLENMSMEELKSLRKDCRTQQFDAEAEKRVQLIELEDEILDVIKTEPQRFESKQIAAYEKAVQEVMGDKVNEDIDFDKESASIKKVAVNIYSSHKELKELIGGQALALKLAVEYYRDIKAGKPKGKEVSEKQNQLKSKRKGTLAVSKQSGQSSSQPNLKSKYIKAKKGGIEEKADFLAEIVDVDQYLS